MTFPSFVLSLFRSSLFDLLDILEPIVHSIRWICCYVYRFFLFFCFILIWRSHSLVYVICDPHFEPVPISYHFHKYAINMKIYARVNVARAMWNKMSIDTVHICFGYKNWRNTHTHTRTPTFARSTFFVCSYNFISFFSLLKLWKNNKFSRFTLHYSSTFEFIAFGFLFKEIALIYGAQGPRTRATCCSSQYSTHTGLFCSLVEQNKKKIGNKMKPS